MKKYRRTAVIVGGLFIFALVIFLIGQSLYDPILSSPDYLAEAYPNSLTVTMGILFEFLSAVSVVFIPILLFPILRKFNVVLAIGYVSFRLFEGVLLSLAQALKLPLVHLSQGYLNNGGNASYYQITGDAIKSIISGVDHGGIIYLVAFGTGALILYSVFYKSRLIPRWLSIWGLIAAVAILIASVLATFDISLEIAMFLVMPIAFQEQAMAIWLIVKGFNPTAIAPESTK